MLGEDEPEEDTTYTDSLDPSNATVADLEQRAARVQQVCREHALPTASINSKEFFVDHVHNLVWCNIFKAASSFWLYKFNVLGMSSSFFGLSNLKLQFNC